MGRVLFSARFRDHAVDLVVRTACLWSEASAGRGRSRGFATGLARRRSDDDSGCAVKGSRVSLSTSVMSRRPTANHKTQSPTWHSAQAGRELVPSPEGWRDPLGSTPANRGACAASNRVRLLRRSSRGELSDHSATAFARADGRARPRGVLAEAGASIGIEVECEQDGHGLLTECVGRTRSVMPETTNRAADDRLEGGAFGLGRRSAQPNGTTREHRDATPRGDSLGATTTSCQEVPSHQRKSSIR